MSTTVYDERMIAMLRRQLTAATNEAGRLRAALESAEKGFQAIESRSRPGPHGVKAEINFLAWVAVKAVRAALSGNAEPGEQGASANGDGVGAAEPLTLGRPLHPPTTSQEAG